ncbi:hypothetical protein GC194_00290 [bacterium]|nr:hypothetical protein [bacterium]
MKTAATLLFSLVFTALGAQDSLSLADFLKRVYQHHPLLSAASENVAMAAGKLKSARGVFDPKVEWSSNEKNYNGTKYYNTNLMQLKIPVYSGIEIKTGYELNTGYYLNPQENTPVGGLLYTEFSVPVLRNLVLNQGRAEVQMRQAYLQQSQYELQLAKNELTYYISTAYWEYKAAFDLFALYDDAVQVAQNRLTFVKKAYQLGKYAAIDTVEAYMEWQRRRSLLKQIEAEFIYNQYALSNQFWQRDSLLLATFKPLNHHLLPFDTMRNISNRVAIETHPAIQQINYKITSAGIDKKLQLQSLLPELTLKYKPLVSANAGMQYSNENITWGATFQMPLYLRKEMGKVQTAEAKYDQLGFEKLYKISSLSNDIKSYEQAMLQLYAAVQHQQKFVAAAQTMLNAEKRKLELGNTSIFMINYRERYLLEATEKLIKTTKDFNKAQTAYLNKLGIDIYSLLQ